MKKKTEMKKKKSYGKLTLILSVLILFVSMLTVPCYITQYEKNYETRKLTAELEEEINRGKRLMIEYKSRVNHKVVEEYAYEKLNMKKLENYQIEYILKESDDKSVVVKNDEEDGFLARLASTFSIVAEYFR